MENPPNERRIFNSTLRRSKRLEAKSGLKRTGWMRSKAPRDRSQFQEKPRTPLKPMSKKKAKALRKDYYPAQNEFLRRPENRYCWICIGRSLRATRSEIREIMSLPVHQGDALLRNANATICRATEVHHLAGRCGRLLAFVPYFVPSGLECREWPHMCAKDARSLGLLASGARYNVFPENAVEIALEYEKWITSF